MCVPAMRRFVATLSARTSVIVTMVTHVITTPTGATVRLTAVNLLTLRLRDSCPKILEKDKSRGEVNFAHSAVYKNLPNQIFPSRVSQRYKNTFFNNDLFCYFCDTVQILTNVAKGQTTAE